MRNSSSIPAKEVVTLVDELVVLIVSEHRCDIRPAASRRAAQQDRQPRTRGKISHAPPGFGHNQLNLVMSIEAGPGQPVPDPPDARVFSGVAGPSIAWQIEFTQCSASRAAGSEVNFATAERRRSADPRRRAASFDHDHVSPFSGEGAVGHAAEPATGANDLEAGGLVQSETGPVLGKDAGLDGPDSCGLG